MKFVKYILALFLIALTINFVSCNNEPIDPILIGNPLNQIVDPNCGSPTNLAASNFIGSSINLNWTAVEQESSWQIEYGVFGFNLGSGTKRVATINSLSVPNLTPTLSYSFYIRSICGNQSFGEWIGPITVNPN